MSHAAKYRKRAVEFEQLKQFDKAVTSYIRAIEEAEGAGEEVDVTLYNKVGDLTLRLGRIPDAVTYYERAVDCYASVGLFNNAIALCNKILRNAPGRSTIYFTLGRICAKKGLRGDASRNFLEYAARMRSEDRTDEAMRALAEVTELMPELTEVRGLVEEYAVRAGIVLTRRKTPVRDPNLGPIESSRDLVFLDVNFALPEERPQPRMQADTVAAAPAARSGSSPVRVSAGANVTRRSSLDDVMIFDPNAADDETRTSVAEHVHEAERPVSDADLTEGKFSIKPLVQSATVIDVAVPGIEQPDEIRDPATGTIDGLTALDPESEEIFPLTTVPLDALTSRVVADTRVAATPDLVDNAATLRMPDHTDPSVAGFGQPIDGLEQVEQVNTYEPLVTESGEFDVSTHTAAVAEIQSLIQEELAGIHDDTGAVAGLTLAIEQEPEQRVADSYRLDPHNFILPGELPPLLIPNDFLRRTAASRVSDSVLDRAAADPDVHVEQVLHEPDREDRAAADEAATASNELSNEFPTPPVPVAIAQAVAAAQARHALLAQAVAEDPQDWARRHRFAEALLEIGDREAGIAELEHALEGFVGSNNLLSAFEVADKLVQVGGHRIRHHQKRVELAVRLGDSARLRTSYLDLADALILVGEDARAHAVYARVLEMDPTDDRARTALGAAAPPLPAAQVDDSYIDLASWLREDDGSSTRMRMHEPTITGNEQADFDSLLRHFKEGVARSIGDDDHDSHYDLGVAYKEMGLLDDAVAEFQKALRSKVHRLPAYEALGQCFVEQGRHQVATTVLSRALHEPGLDDGHRIGVLYLLGYSLEALQRIDDARSYFQRVYATDRHFRDVAARLAALDQVAQ